MNEPLPAEARGEFVGERRWGLPAEARKVCSASEGGALRILNWFKQRGQQDTVVFDDVGVTRRLADGRVETLAWADLQEVGVMTTDEGPWSEDVFFMLAGPGRTGVLVPQGADGSQALVERLLRLPGFNQRLFIEAMGSTSNRRFVCWKRADVS